MKAAALIPAAGKGTRMQRGMSKLLIPLCGIPLIIHTLSVFEKNALIDSIVVATPPGASEEFQDLLRAHGIRKVTKLVAGGSERQHSVFNMLKAMVDDPPDLVVIHDGARPFLSQADLTRVLNIPERCDGIVLGVLLKDTIKRVDGEQVITDTPRREEFCLAHTPQVFSFNKICTAHKKAREEGWAATDDAGLVEHYGGRVKVLFGSPLNFKITTEEDLLLAEMLLKAMGDGFR
jgi:2-C-methyl-D-erythritol 4-phosphate cytidylyltransferase